MTTPQTKATPFEHSPRPALVSEDYRLQRYYGYSSPLAINGLLAPDSEHRVRLFRWRGEDVARLELFVPSGQMRVALDVAALRELARCLIDAAADLEWEESLPLDQRLDMSLEDVL